MHSFQPRRSAGLIGLVACCCFSALPIGSGAEDGSLSAEDYVLNGLPSPNRRWSSTDYARAAIALREIASVDTARLPRFQSALSGRVFQRIVDPDNLVSLQDTGLRVNARAAEGTRVLGQLRNLLLLYLQPTGSGEHLDVECVELIGLVLTSSGLTLPLLEGFLGSLAPDDPKLHSRVDGIEQVRASLNEMMLTSLTWLGEREVYTVRARERLATHLGESLPGILPLLPDTVRITLYRGLRAAALGEPEPSVRMRLDRVIVAVERSAG
jgi:hypothetical protein